MPVGSGSVAQPWLKKRVTNVSRVYFPWLVVLGSDNCNLGYTAKTPVKRTVAESTRRGPDSSRIFSTSTNMPGVFVF